MHVDSGMTDVRPYDIAAMRKIRHLPHIHIPRSGTRGGVNQVFVTVAALVIFQY
jgi:hypothetical protein